MHVSMHNSEDLAVLRRRIRGETNAKQRDRCRAVLLALEGTMTAEIQQKLARSKNFVQRWVYAYRDGGLNAIRAKKPPGAKPKLPRSQESCFLRRIEEAEQTLRGEDIRQILSEEFGVRYSLQGAYDLLHRLGFEPLRPRPSNPKKDPAAEARWREGAPFLSRRWRRPIQRRT